MSNSSPSRPFGRRKSTGNVTVIETKVHRTAERNAQVAGIVLGLITALTTAAIASDSHHPIVAVFIAAAVAIPVAAVAYGLVRIWPAIRLIWWWILESALALLLTFGWVQLAEHTAAPVTLAVLVLVVGVPAAIPALRNRIKAVGWCVVVRHRLRVCFAQFITANKSGSLPLILWAKPTPVGERVWVYLRPGLSLTMLQARLEQIAVACHAKTCLVESASDGNAAYLRFDIKRREVLTKNVKTSLVDQVDTDAPRVPRQPVVVPTALDLPDVIAQPVTLPAAVKSATSANGKKPATTASTSPDGGDDITDWI